MSRVASLRGVVAVASSLAASHRVPQKQGMLCPGDFCIKSGTLCEHFCKIARSVNQTSFGQLSLALGVNFETKFGVCVTNLAVGALHM